MFYLTTLAHTKSTLALSIPSSTIVSIATPQPKSTPTIIVISQPLSFSDPSSIIAIIGLIIAFLGIIVAAVTLFFIIKYVRDTAAMAKATSDSAEATQKSAEAAENTLREMKRAREEENAPSIIVYFNYTNSTHTIYLVVENIGKSVARDVMLEFWPPLQGSKISRKNLENNSLLKNGLQSIVPNYKIPIPFDYLTSYLRENLPLEYTVKVTYHGNEFLPKQELKYVLDLKPYQYTHFVTEQGLPEINETLKSFAIDHFQYLNDFKSISLDLKEISNAVNRSVMAQFNPRADGTNIDILARLKEFVLIWTLDYGKEEEKLIKASLFNLRTRCLLLKDEILIGVANSDPHQWIEDVKTVIRKISKLGNMMLLIDGYVVAQSMRGHSIEDFNNLGDSIIEDIKGIIEQIHNANNNSLVNSKGDTIDSVSIMEEQNGSVSRMNSSQQTYE